MDNKEGYLSFTQYKRVLKLARKPGRDELSAVAKVAFFGMCAIGVLGFAIFAVMDFIPM